MHTDHNDLTDNWQTNNPTNQSPLNERSFENAFKTFSAKELSEQIEEKKEWVVEDLLARGDISILISKPKCGKSTLARQLSHCVSKSHPFLGKATHQTPVLYLCLEESRREVRDQVKKMGSSSNKEIHFVFSDEVYGRTIEESLQSLGQTVEKTSAGLVIIDILSRFVPIKDINSYSEVNSKLSPIISFARKNNIHLCLLHHSKKGAGAITGDIDSTLGSTSLTGSVDVIMCLTSDNFNNRFISVPGARGGIKFPKTALDFNPETFTSTLGGSAEEVAIQAKAKEICSLLKNSEGVYLTIEEIMKSVQGKKHTITQAINTLIPDKVHKIGEGVKGSPFEYGIPKENKLVSKMNPYLRTPLSREDV